MLSLADIKENPVFVDSAFEMNMYLENDDGEIQTDHADLPLKAELLFHSEGDGDRDPAPESMFAVDEEAVISNGKGTLKCRIKEVSMNVGNRAFCIRLTPAAGAAAKGSKKKTTAAAAAAAADSSLVAALADGVETEAIEVVRHRLVLEEEFLAGWDKEF